MFRFFGARSPWVREGLQRGRIQVQMPVSGSDVMFGIQNVPTPLKGTKLPPPKKASVRSGSSRIVPLARVVWHAPHDITWLTR